jgi:uracil-DNA glycosylase
MSDPLEIVHDALTRLRDGGSRAHASSAVLSALAATANSQRAVSQPAGKKTATTQPVAPPQEPPPFRKLTDMVAAQLSDPKPQSTPPAPAPPLLASPFTLIPGATTIAPASGTKAERLAAMRDPVLACTLCPHLVKSRTQVVFGVGNPEAELMFVGEAPGADEDRQGEPFVGRAGQLLTKLIETMGFKRSDVYIGNVLKCRPDMPPGESGNRKPTGPEMKTCKPYLLEQINIIQPCVIVALGATAVEGLFGIEKAGITKMRGNWKDFNGIPVMPTFHPSFLLRPTSELLANKRRVWEDMLAVLEKLGRPISEKQRAFFSSVAG